MVHQAGRLLGAGRNTARSDQEVAMRIVVEFSAQDAARVDAVIQRDTGGISRTAWARMALMRAVKESESKDVDTTSRVQGIL